MIDLTPPTALGDYSLENLTSKQLKQVQRLYKDCQDFFDLVDGESASPETARETFESVPQGKQITDKFVAGLWGSGHTKLEGLLEGVRDYPEPGIWWIGLLLLAPAARGKGLGRQVVGHFYERILNRQARAVMLGVVAENTGALAFWESLGFNQVYQTEPRSFGKKIHTVHVLRLDISSADFPGGR